MECILYCVYSPFCVRILFRVWGGAGGRNWVYLFFSWGWDLFLAVVQQLGIPMADHTYLPRLTERCHPEEIVVLVVQQWCARIRIRDSKIMLRPDTDPRLRIAAPRSESEIAKLCARIRIRDWELLRPDLNPRFRNAAPGLGSELW